MSRVLKALKQIEARSPAEQPPEPSTPPAEPHSPAEQAQSDQTSGPAEAIRGEEAMDAALARAERAAATAAEISIGPAAPESPPAQPPDYLGREHARAYGRLAEKILAQLSSGRPASLMFTSTADGCGTTAVLRWLSRALPERIDGEVLLVDGNLRNPRLAPGLGIQPGQGLADVLTRSADWRRVVQRTGVANLSVLPGATPPTLGARLPEPLDLAPLLAQLNSHYRLVLLDTASLLYPEVGPMAGCCDGVYLVVRLGHTLRRAVGEAASVIRKCRGRLLGCVVVERW